MAECEVKFAPDVTTDIKASWLLNGTEVKVESVQSTQDLGGETSYYFTRECNVTNFGNLTCRAQLVDDQRVISESNRTIEFIFPVQPKINSIEGATLNVTDSATLRCTAQGFPRPDIQWVFEERIIQPENGKIVIDYINDTTSASSSLILKNVERRDNGSYICEASNSYGRAVSTAVLYVHSRPEISIISALGISDDSLYLHWTLKNGNLPIMNYHVKYMEEGNENWFFSNAAPDVSSTSHIITGLKANTTYRVQLEAENRLGRSNRDEYQNIVTLSSKADYKPTVELKGSTFNSFTLGWTAPPEKIRYLIGHFVAIYTESSSGHMKMKSFNISYTEADGQPVHLFTDLEPATMYFFKVRACQRYVDHCSEFSDSVNGTTLDGKPTEPRKVHISCNSPPQNEGNLKHSVDVTWETPAKTNGQLAHYRVR